MQVFAVILLFLGVTVKVYGYCFEEAGKRFGINPLILYSIAKVESGLNPYAVNTRNRNGTYDIGLMQINSSWLPVLEKNGITKQMLFDPCVNTMVGTWILRQCVDRYGNSWKAIDCYNKGSKAREVSAYIYAVYRAYSKASATRHIGYALLEARGGSVKPEQSFMFREGVSEYLGDYVFTE